MSLGARTARGGGWRGALTAPIRVARRLLRWLLADPARGVHLVIIILLALVLLLLWRLDGGPWTITERFWLLGRRGSIGTLVWLVAAAAIASLTAGWMGGPPLRARLLITWLVAALIAALAFPREISAIARALW